MVDRCCVRVDAEQPHACASSVDYYQGIHDSSECGILCWVDVERLCSILMSPGHLQDGVVGCLYTSCDVFDIPFL